MSEVPLHRQKERWGSPLGQLTSRKFRQTPEIIQEKTFKMCKEKSKMGKSLLEVRPG
jgi:hypothetical protein